LILDEPTNHLDIASKNILKAAMEKFEGTLLVVSHDRTFLSDLTDRIIEIKPNGVTEYIGGIDAFLNEKRKESIVAFERLEKIKIAKKAEKPSQNTFKQRKEFEKQHRKLNNQVKRLEAELEKKMNTKEEMEDKMADPGIFNSDSYPELIEKHGQMLASITQIEKEWEEAMLELESLEDPDLS
jgi:ATP-binding cassette subfamily F protein 3